MYGRFPSLSVVRVLLEEVDWESGIDAGKALRNWKGVFGGQNKQRSECLLLLSLLS